MRNERLPKNDEMIKVKTTKEFGRGVYAAQDINRGTIVLVNEGLFFTPKEANILEQTLLQYYMYNFGLGKRYAIALGLGSLFNHSEQDNIDYYLCEKTKRIKYKAMRNIKKGEQLFIDYGYKPTTGKNAIA